MVYTVVLLHEADGRYSAEALLDTGAIRRGVIS